MDLETRFKIASVWVIGLSVLLCVAWFLGMKEKKYFTKHFKEGIVSYEVIAPKWMWILYKDDNVGTIVDDGDRYTIKGKDHVGFTNVQMILTRAEAYKGVDVGKYFTSKEQQGE